MKRILILVTISLSLSSTASPQGGGGESTKKGSREKKAVTTKKNSGTKSVNMTSPKPPLKLPHTRTNHVGIEFVLIPPGSFMMGGPYEKPVHQVTISYSFYMGKYEVTQAQWRSVMGSNPSHFTGDNLPVINADYGNDIAVFIARLNAQNDGYTYRLPTEAEWEYACRAGTNEDYAGDLDSMAWYGNNSGNSRLDADAIWRDDRSGYHTRVMDNGNKMHSVGTKQPNAWGLYDMHGNVWELVQDFIEEYKAGPAVDPSGPATGQQRVLRGGSWYDHATQLRCASRISSYAPRDRGIRVVAVARTR